MFPPNPLVNLLLLKSLAQAQALHPVRVCHFLFEATHAHLLLVVDNPDDVKGFMERFKTESAHAINKLLGRRKRTLWCKGYDSPVVLDIDKAVEQIAYLYENPSKDGLEDSIERYPGLSSWSHFRKRKSVFLTRFIPRDVIRPLKYPRLSLYEYRKEAKALCARRKQVKFRIEPNAWLEAFGVIDSKEKTAYNDRIYREVRQREANHRASRSEEGKTVIGAARLKEEQIGREYERRAEGRKMICLGSTKQIRAPFIAHVKELIERAREVRLEWLRGNITVPYPLGLYPPALPKRAEVLVFE